jgi:PKD repeat protein
MTSICPILGHVGNIGREKMKTYVKFFLTIVILSVITAGIFLFGMTDHTAILKNPIEKQSYNDINRSLNGRLLNSYVLGIIGNISITAKMPESSDTLMVYTGVFNDGDNIKLFPGTSKEGGNVTPEVDAPNVAKKILEQFGGLPSDAIYSGATTHYVNFVSRSTGDVTRRQSSYTSVFWWRMLNGKRIIGDNDIIYIELGDNGDPLVVIKRWRNYTYAGNVMIIPAIKAITKLENNDVINPPLLDNQEDINIYGISLGYYAKNIEAPEITLEPVWIFYGNTSSGSYLSLEVYARQFTNFTATPTSGLVPLTVSFTDTSDASPVEWYWDFGDGTNSTAQSPTHTYTTAATYNVTFRASNDLGSDTIMRTNFVRVGTVRPLIANFTATPLSGKVPLTVQFNDTSENLPTVWKWDFGDMTNSTEQDPAYTYTVAGNYTVNLTVINTIGTDTKTETDLITVFPLNPPFPNFTATPRSGKVPLTVMFNDTSTGGQPTLRYWTFGDATNSTEQDPIHTYTAPGNYMVELELTNGDADVFENRTDYIRVLPLELPVANFTASPTSGTAPLAVTFRDTSENKVTAWSWDFGDGTTSLVQSPSHTYTATGSFTVILNVTNTDGDASLIKPGFITVKAPPTTAPTTKLTTRPTRQPLSPLTAVAGLCAICLLYVAMRRK